AANIASDRAPVKWFLTPFFLPPSLCKFPQSISQNTRLLKNPTSAEAGPVHRFTPAEEARRAAFHPLALGEAILSSPLDRAAPLGSRPVGYSHQVPSRKL